MDFLADARRRAFSFWLRTGRLPRWAGGGTAEVKFNPWHDPDNGRFTFAGTGRYFGRGSSSRAKQPGDASFSRNRRDPSFGGFGGGGQGFNGGGADGSWDEPKPEPGKDEPYGGYGGGSSNGGGASGSWPAPEPDSQRGRGRQTRRGRSPNGSPLAQTQTAPRQAGGEAMTAGTGAASAQMGTIFGSTRQACLGSSRAQSLSATRRVDLALPSPALEVRTEGRRTMADISWHHA